MVEIVYYVATSLDGYIATLDGGIEWLPTPGDESDYGYAEFYASIDALIMGRQTYEKVLGFGEWVYPNKPCWVLSQQKIQAEHPQVTITSNSPTEMIEMLQASQFKRVWLVGGGQLAASFRAEGLISEYVIGMIPVILGEGIPLFAASGPQEKLNLIECKPFPKGVVLLKYLSDRTA